jgi:type II secretory pathway component GspD/PulD (secretin)
MSLRSRIGLWALMGMVWFVVAGEGAPAQVAPGATPAANTATQPAGELVTLDFPPDGVEVSLLADIVTQRLHIPIMYDETIRGRKVVIRVPTKVPESSLMGILQTALRLKNMALVDAEQPGWKQVILAPNLAAVAKPAGEGPTEGAIAQVFVLEHADPVHVAEIIRPFTTQPSGYVQAQPGQKVMVVCDYGTVLKRIEAMIHSLDMEAPPVEVKFIPLKEAEAAAIVPALTQLIANRETFQWGNATGSGIYLTADERTNQVTVVAPPTRMKDIEELVAGMDKTPDLKTKVYRLKAVSPERVDRLIKSLLGPSLAKRAYQAAIDKDSSSLIVSATADVHQRIDELIKGLDLPAMEAASNPIQFYKLKNTKASDILATITGLLAEPGSEGYSQQRAGGGPEGPNSTPPGPGTPAPAPGAPNSMGASQPGVPILPGSASTGISTPGSLPNTPAASLYRQNNPGSVAGAGGGGAAGAGTGQGAVLSVHNKDATVTADVNSNSIIVIAPPPIQMMYADLIKRLDERRPQVQIECTIVSLNTSDSFSFGVDIGKLGGFNTSKLLTLSSFGVSSPNAATGQLTPGANGGGTFALLSPNIADIVLNALAGNSRARFVSAPQLLVNDNGKGKLESVAQEPYSVILDASSVQSVTSFGGQAEAGTSISVEPHISEADYLQLTYSIELSNFTGASSNGLPPPSQKNTVDSSVTIPDGYTIVVGGLTTRDFSASTSTIPILGDIPILKYLFGTRNRNNNDSTLFVFIKPIILRDDKFEDLKYISSKRQSAASVPGDFPQSEPIPMR